MTIEATETSEQVSQMSTLASDPHTWVLAAFVIFFALFGRKIFGGIFKGLDGRTSRIRSELDEAKKLREEAETLLKSYKARHQASLREAEEILTRARQDADRLVLEADRALQEQLASRMRMAEEKIASAETQAIEEVQNHVVDITISAAKALILENIGQTSGDELLARAIADIERKVH